MVSFVMCRWLIRLVCITLYACGVSHTLYGAHHHLYYSHHHHLTHSTVARCLHMYLTTRDPHHAKMCSLVHMLPFGHHNAI